MTNNQTVTNDQLLDNIYTAHLSVISATSHLDCAVQRARDEGVTWEQIGRTLGYTKQGAQQRFR